MQIRPMWLETEAGDKLRADRRLLWSAGPRERFSFHAPDAGVAQAEVQRE